MKKFSKYGMLLVAALCVGMESCSDDDGSEGLAGGFASNNPLVTEGKMLLTRIECSEDDHSEIFTVIYDDQYRPVQIKDKDGHTSVNYKEGNLFDEKGETGTVTFTRGGYIQSMSSHWSGFSSWTVSCIYDSGGGLTQYDHQEQEDEEGRICQMSNVWKEGNLLKSKRFDKETNDGINKEEWYECTIDYYNKENRYRQFTPGFIDAIKLDADLAYVGLFGIGPKQLPRKIVCDVNDVYTFEYSLNDDESIRQEKVIHTKDGNDTSTVTYKYYYTPIN